MRLWSRVMVLFVVCVGPALAGSLTAPAAVATGTRTQMAPPVQAAAMKQIKGSWKIAGYRNWHAGKYVEIAVHKERIDETMETWLFRPDGTFRHQMDETIWFTGQWSVTEKWVFEGGSYAVLHLKDIQTFLPNQRRKEEFYLCTYIDNGRNLVVFQPTKSLAAGQGLNQGHVFESKPYGER